MNRARLYFKKVISRIDAVSMTALICFVFISMTFACAITPLEGERELTENIIRFHVLANSDSKADQELKLLVRDSVTEYTTVLLAGCRDVTTAKRLILENRSAILEKARDCIAANGYDHRVTFELGTESYPKRQYGKYIFPAGEYCSLRLGIGEAKGRNWWCVLFPPMCRGSATVEKYDDIEELKKIGFSDNEIGVISETDNIKTEIRFYFLDFITKMK